MRCFLCAKSNFRLIYRLNNKKILQCRHDGLFLVQETKRLLPLYSKDYFYTSPTSPVYSANQGYFHAKLKTIKRLTRERRPKILDVGCGWGDFLQFLKRKRLPYLGIDVNQEAIRICKRKGLRSRCLPIEKLISKGLLPDRKQQTSKQYSAITLFQVIEHLKNPLPLLRSAKKLLKKNGVLLLTTPNNDSPLRKIFRHRWSIYNERTHYVFYNKRTLEKVLVKAGFKKIKIKIDRLRFLSSAYIFKRLNEMMPHPIFHFLFSVFSHYPFPVPTDPWGDLEATAFKK